MQKLADGTVITVETHGLLARSSAGQVREDIHSNVSGIVSGRMLEKNTPMASVADPSAHTITMWQTAEEKSALKTAMVMHLPVLSKAQGGVLAAVGSSGPPPPVVKVAPPSVVAAKKKDPNTVTTEDLGKQSIQGLLVSGIRTTTTIPVGEIGNDRPIVATHEVWTSPELGIVVKQVDIDPRTGERTMELMNVSKTEPIAALFAPPEGYKCKTCRR
ncbi:MAG TPA: hypothetical protein VK638_13325 [Edaphobacter sp.]|nr:hypothetical protein [Edaphobacter sp.]